MKQLALIFALALPMPAVAQETPTDDGPSLMERGAKLFFRGLMEEMDPALQGLRNFVEEAGPEMERFVDEMGPALTDLFDKVDDFADYHGPEVLPNGDIILRKKTPEELDLPKPAPNGEIEL